MRSQRPRSAPSAAHCCMGGTSRQSPAGGGGCVRGGEGRGGGKRAALRAGRALQACTLHTRGLLPMRAPRCAPVCSTARPPGGSNSTITAPGQWLASICQGGWEGAIEWDSHSGTRANQWWRGVAGTPLPPPSLLRHPSLVPQSPSHPPTHPPSTHPRRCSARPPPRTPRPGGAGAAARAPHAAAAPPGARWGGSSGSLRGQTWR